MFTVTVRYFGSNNTWERTFTKVEALYNYLDAVKPFINYSKVTDEIGYMVLEKYYGSDKGPEKQTQDSHLESAYEDRFYSEE